MDVLLFVLQTKNISNPECVSVLHGNNSANHVWGRDTSVCKVLSNDSLTVKCECSGQGFYTATTDMYNVNVSIITSTQCLDASSGVIAALTCQ